MPKRISVVDTPSQQLSFSSKSRNQTIGLHWNTTAKDWFLDYKVGNTWLLHGRRVTINANLLAGVQVQSVLLAVNSSDNESAITYQSLIDGNTRLYFYTGDEVLAALAPS